MEKWSEELRREDGSTTIGLTFPCHVRLNRAFRGVGDPQPRASQIRLLRHPFVRICRGGQALSLPPKQLVLRKFRNHSSAEEGRRWNRELTHRVNPADTFYGSGVWEVSDDVLIKILSVLGPIDLVSAVSVMPCMKLKLFPHQQAAVEWMLQRERDTELLPHPLYMDTITEDGFAFYINTVSGEMVTGSVPTIKDFQGGMFRDEPGLGKSTTALSLILKTQGTMAELPDGVQVIWCTHNADHRCGYHELNGDNLSSSNMLLNKGVVGHHTRRRQLSFFKCTSRESMRCSLEERVTFSDTAVPIAGSTDLSQDKGINSPTAACTTPASCVVRSTRILSRIRRSLLHRYEVVSHFSNGWKVRNKSSKRRRASNGLTCDSLDERVGISYGPSHDSHHTISYVTWIQCDACRKWQKLADASMADAS
ncbi:hypothetical protein U1Q18_027480 [Sarracenia purpurea var. burkii]